MKKFTENEPQMQIKNLKDIELGDIVFFKASGTLLQKVIKTAQGIRSKTNSDIVHVALCVDKTNTGIPIIGHLTPAGFRIESLLQRFKRVGQDESLRIFRLAEIEELDIYRCLVTQAIENYKERKVIYDNLGALHSFFSHKVYSNNARVPVIKKAFCSSMIAKCLIEAKIPGFENYYPNVLPKKLYQACKKNNLFFELTYIVPQEQNSIKENHAHVLGFSK